jgi:hypothetical protein
MERMAMKIVADCISFLPRWMGRAIDRRGRQPDGPQYGSAEKDTTDKGREITELLLYSSPVFSPSSALGGSDS